MGAWSGATLALFALAAVVSIAALAFGYATTPARCRCSRCSGRRARQTDTATLPRRRWGR